jgi:hypothetical protein
MTTDKAIMERLLRVIEGHGEIGRMDLLKKANVKISRYNQLKTYFEEEYQYRIKYDRESRTWYSLDYLLTKQTREDEQKTLENSATPREIQT